MNIQNETEKFVKDIHERDIKKVAYNRTWLENKILEACDLFARHAQTIKILTQASEQQGKRIEELEAEAIFVCVCCGKIDPAFIVECRECRKKGENAKINQLEAANAAAKKEIEKHRWIPVSEKLPKYAEYVMLYFEKTQMVHEVFYNRSMNFEGVTYWKPIVLPEQANSQA
jgi:predicted RNA-binding Zn-ribbon protein involved in translation (DUF1610 family)